MTKPDDLLPSAKDFMQKLALAEAEEASKQARKLAEAEAEKKALFEQLIRPSGVADEERIKRVVKIVERAMSNGKSKVELGRFANNVCDRGARHQSAEPGWDFPGGMPNDIGMPLSWG